MAKVSASPEEELVVRTSGGLRIHILSSAAYAVKYVMKPNRNVVKSLLTFYFMYN